MKFASSITMVVLGPRRVMSATHIYRVSILSAIAILLSACTPSGPVHPSRIVDLSPTITEDLPVQRVGERFLTDLGFPVTTEFEHFEGTAPLYYLDTFVTLFNHAGPHVDAPIHLIDGGIPAGDYDLERFFGKAKVLDFSHLKEGDTISLEDVQSYDIEAGDIVIFYVGYVPPTSPEEYPAFAVPSAETAEYLATLPVKAYAVDSPSVDSIINLFRMASEGVTEFAELLPVHHAFLTREVPIIEGLVNLEAIATEESVVFVGFPLKMTGKGGDAGLMRAAALIY